MKYKLVLEELEGEFKESDKNFLHLLNCFYIKPVKVLKTPLKGCSFISSITVVPENIRYQPFPPLTEAHWKL